MMYQFIKEINSVRKLESEWDSQRFYCKLMFSKFTTITQFKFNEKSVNKGI